MKNKALRKIFISIIIPAIISILLFFLSVWLIIVPIVEKNMMDDKKEMLSELTQTAWSLIEEYYHDYTDSIYTLNEAQQLAISKIELMRYGNNGKDYFWITDMQPTMIMHPYRKELNNTSLENYQDPNGFKLFVESVNIVKSSGEGYLNYYWQWKDDTTRIVPKLSYVKGFPEWDWIVGTGIYLEDVRTDIRLLKNKIIRISLFITLITALLLLYIIKQSLKIENNRLEAEDGLKQSREKYKSLVEASPEGTLMLSNNQVIYANKKFCDMLGYHISETIGKKLNDLFDISWDIMLLQLEEPGKSVAFETMLKTKSGKKQETVLSISKTYADNETRVIITTKEMGNQQRLQLASNKLSDKLQTALLMMNLPTNTFSENLISCNIDTSIADAVKIMKKKDKDFIFITQNESVIGIINTNDLKNRVIASEISLNDPVSKIMTAPILDVLENLPISEALFTFSKNNISHLLLTNTQGQARSVIRKSALWNSQNNVLNILLNEISSCENKSELKSIFAQTPLLVKSLIDGGIKVQLLTQIISRIIDEITTRTIVLSIELLGTAPCNFAFIAMGSEGRREQTLTTDQDNAIVFDDTHANNKETASYFLNLANEVNETLNYVGIHLCNGNMMARNPEWNQPLSQWKQYFSKWINHSDPKSILDSAIFFDLRCIYGDNTFAEILQQHILDEVKHQAVFFQHMAQTIIATKTPSIGNNTQIDLKRILMPIIGFARIYSLKLSHFESGTINRLEHIAESQLITPEALRELKKAYTNLMSLRIQNQSIMLLEGKIPENIINTDSLSGFDINCLKKSISIIAEYQIQLTADFKGTF
jgi:PAS domain S-box-containing protein